MGELLLLYIMPFVVCYLILRWNAKKTEMDQKERELTTICTVVMFIPIFNMLLTIFLLFVFIGMNLESIGPSWWKKFYMIKDK